MASVMRSVPLLLLLMCMQLFFFLRLVSLRLDSSHAKAIVKCMALHVCILYALNKLLPESTVNFSIYLHTMLNRFCATETKNEVRRQTEREQILFECVCVCIG